LDSTNNENLVENLSEAEETKEGFEVDSNANIEEKPQENVVVGSFIREIFEWLEVIITAVIAVVFIFSLLFRVATIDGPSMKETLHHGDKVIISNFLYTPKHGDIVVVSRNKTNTLEGVLENEMPIIKRVIALEGQTVDIDFEKGVVFVDGKALSEPYTATPTNLKGDVQFPLTVSPGCVFVLGDNRNDSMDSRDSRIGNEGMVDKRYILGRAMYKIYPFSDVGGLYNE